MSVRLFWTGFCWFVYVDDLWVRVTQELWEAIEFLRQAYPDHHQQLLT